MWVLIISMAQQASPKDSVHSDDFLARANSSSDLAVRAFGRTRLITLSAGELPLLGS
jgi:hypothetical protein